MGNTTTAYAPCPYCTALNMTHRSHCYKCRNPLSGVAGVIGVAEAQGTQAQFRPVAMDTRRQARYEVCLDEVVLEGDGIPRQSVTVHDISPGGISVHTTVPFPRGTPVRLYVSLRGQTWAMTGTTRHSAPVLTEKGRVYLCGIEFEQVSPELQDVLERVLGR